jgi:chromosome segregation ATPase
MEKYEIFRNRNESLEKLAVEKESLYNEIKIDYDKMSQSNFKLQKSHEELKNAREILDSKLRKIEENVKGKDEQYKTIKIQKDRYEGQCKVLNEQL